MIGRKLPMTIAPKINEAPTCHLFFNPFQARLSTAENAQPKLSRVTGSAIMWACRSAYINVNNGNSVMGADSLGAGMMRVGIQANTSVGRFLRLYMRNVAGLRVKADVGTDKGSIAQGMPAFDTALALVEARITALLRGELRDSVSIP